MATSLSTAKNDLLEKIATRIVGQRNAIERIAAYVQTYQAGLTPEGRPAGVFLLLGPTGTGKTRTVEALAEVLHGSGRDYLRIDCGELQLDHEVAKLIGAPPGYLGHRETTPRLSQGTLTSITSEHCKLSLVLFDEIEKSAPSLATLLLGVLDKGILTLGDNSVVNFENSFIFLTSNLGAREMIRELDPSFGFQAITGQTVATEQKTSKLESIALAAVSKRFSPEFVNRIDAVVTYQPLERDAIEQILDHQIEDLQEHVNRRLGPHCFSIKLTDSAKEFLLARGVSAQHGARELKRTIHRHLIQPLATLVAENLIPTGYSVTFASDGAADRLSIQTGPAEPVSVRRETARVLIVDDSEALLKLLKSATRSEPWEVFTAINAEQALSVASKHRQHVGLIDYLLPDFDGIRLSKQLQSLVPSIAILLTSGSSDVPATDFPFIQKPFLVEEVLASIRARVSTHASSVAR